MEEKQAHGGNTLQIRCSNEVREQFRALSRKMNKPTGVTLAALIAAYEESGEDEGPLPILMRSGREGQAIASALSIILENCKALQEKAVQSAHEVEETKERYNNLLSGRIDHYEKLLAEKEETVQQLSKEVERLKGLEKIADSAQKNYDSIRAENDELKNRLSVLEGSERKAAELAGKLAVYEQLEKAGILKR